MRPVDFIEVSSFEEIVHLVNSGVPEDLHLEYKSGQPKNRDKFNLDIATDVSAFANSDGGLILIGVTEAGRIPIAIDGVDELEYNRESVGQAIATRVSPYIPGLRIQTLRGPNKVVLAVSVPRSTSTPHQGPKHTYYRRFEHFNQPLPHHEIEDLRLRRITALPLVSVMPDSRGVVLAVLDIKNPGNHLAKDLDFRLPSEFPWLGDQPPPALRNGIKALNPGQHLRFDVSTFPELLADAGGPAVFELGVEYTHSALDRRESFDCTLDFESYRGSSSILSEEQSDRRKLLTEIQSAVKALTALKESSRTMEKLVGASGLDLSVSTLRNVGRLMRGQAIEKLPARWFNVDGFRNALGVEIELAIELDRLFLNRTPTLEEVRTVPGMTEELFERFNDTFSLPPASV